jgi:23S rRNA (adenine2503-C2)-methyltransferase
MINLYGLAPQPLETMMLAMGQKKFRAIQLYTWLYEKKARSFEEMSDVSLRFREELAATFTLDLPSIATQQIANDGTIKLLLEMADGAKVETVLMRYDYGNALCVSSQVGCNMGCAFCASGLLRKQRNLEVHELIGQFMVMQQLLGNDDRISHVVVMGTGEPFDNYDNIMDFIRILNHPKALAIGARHITVSTCGLVDRIRQYAHEGIQINLAISLHAPNDELRSKLMRINQAYPLDALLDAVKYYETTSGRRVTFEYIMLRDVNDLPEHAHQLADRIKGIQSYVNLIPYNEVGEVPFHRSGRERVRLFCDLLKQRGVNCTIRKEFGVDIDAACGQLRAKKEGVMR